MEATAMCNLPPNGNKLGRQLWDDKVLLGQLHAYHTKAAQSSDHLLNYYGTRVYSKAEVHGRIVDCVMIMNAACAA